MVVENHFIMYYTGRERQKDSLICQGTKGKAAFTIVKLLSKCPIQKLSCKWVIFSQDVINFYCRVEEGREQPLPKLAAPRHYPPEHRNWLFFISVRKHLFFWYFDGKIKCVWGQRRRLRQSPVPSASPTAPTWVVLHKRAGGGTLPVGASFLLGALGGIRVPGQPRRVGIWGREKQLMQLWRLMVWSLVSRL